MAKKYTNAFLDAATRAANVISCGVDPDFAIYGAARRNGVDPAELTDYLYPVRRLRRVIRDDTGRTLFDGGPVIR